MNIKHILLGTAAALVVATGAQAADLPGEAVPTAVDYVKVCDAFGAGFFYIPGGETCLDISGRVRTGVSFETQGADSVSWFADGRVDFDARTATEYGMLRSFFRIVSQSDGDAGIGQAYIQLGYLTLGYTDDFMDSFGSLFGDDDRNNFASTQLLASVMVDDLGGGFYVGAQVLSTLSDPLKATYTAGSDDDLEAQAIIGISGQPWGSAALAVAYDEDIFVKAGATFVVTDPLSVAAQVSYNGEAEWLFGGIGASYGFTDDLTGYANFGYYFNENGDDTFGVTVGADYTVTSGLVLTTEINYEDAGADEYLEGLIRLNRSW